VVCLVRLTSEDCNRSGDLIVEFYDCDYEHTRYGQFTGGRYYLSTILSGFEEGSGLDLHGGVPGWEVHPKCYTRVMEWLSAYAPQISYRTDDGISIC